jgi:hypothetical protein
MRDIYNILMWRKEALDRTGSVRLRCRREMPIAHFNRYTHKIPFLFIYGADDDDDVCPPRRRMRPVFINGPQWYIINLWCGHGHFFLCAHPAILVIDLCSSSLLTWAAKTNEKLFYFYFPVGQDLLRCARRAAAGKCLSKLPLIDGARFQINMILVSKVT